MSLPLAAAGAIALALAELSIAPHLQVGGLKPDLVLIAVVSISSVFGLERAIGWAFVGGLMLDLLSAGPYRPLGATAFALLVVAGLAATASRLLPAGRVAVTVALVFLLALLYHLSILAFLSLTGVSADDPLGASLPLATLDAVLAVPVAVLAILLARRVRPAEGLGW